MKVEKRKIASAPATETTHSKWKGDDWTEISEFLGLDIEAEDELIASETHKQLSQLRYDAGKAYVGGTYPESSKQKIKEIRRFVEKIADHSPTDAPLWQGLTAIEDDARFIEYVDVLLECMWT